MRRPRRPATAGRRGRSGSVGPGGDPPKERDGVERNGRWAVSASSPPEGQERRTEASRDGPGLSRRWRRRFSCWASPTRWSRHRHPLVPGAARPGDRAGHHAVLQRQHGRFPGGRGAGRRGGPVRRIHGRPSSSVPRSPRPPPAPSGPARRSDARSGQGFEADHAADDATEHGILATETASVRSPSRTPPSARRRCPPTPRRRSRWAGSHRVREPGHAEDQGAGECDGRDQPMKPSDLPSAVAQTASRHRRERERART